jgi:3-methyl-2-oxobutanoate hydroxymethyltransferase
MSDTPTAHFGIADLQRAYRDGDKLVMLTAYDAPSARAAERAGVDLVLVGDSAAMVVLGHDTTNAVGMEEMLLLTKAVTRVSKRPLVVADLPFMSYQPSDELAIVNAGRMIAEGGADSVKLEGGGRMIDRVRAISDAGIAVFGHLGLTPQSAARLGGFRAQARTHEQALLLLEDALTLEAAGAVGVVLEAIPEAVAQTVTEKLSIPTIGIGAGVSTSGQVLVYHDVVGFTEGHLPRFVRRYADLGAAAEAAIREYVNDVRTSAFPAPEHTYGMLDDERAAFLDAVAARSRS